MHDPIYCAIGDIHGELGRLKDVHRQVLAFAAGELKGRPLQFVHLGDLVDRGPDSCGVIEQLMEFERAHGPRAITLRGNHEQMMIDAHDAPGAHAAPWRHWMNNGGEATLASYAGKPEAVRLAHVAWLKSLPTVHADEEAGLVFVHAGIDPDLYPDCGAQVNMWTRRREFMDPRCWTAPALRGLRVIHGHTPTHDFRPEAAGDGRRLNIDTGVVCGGCLTAALLRPGAADLFFHG
ncbi:MAG: serine/threonine protein phosphatase [Hyphomonas sp.]|uniref:metallophosphoesterase n=1 Tax=Hyphomonas sp. TaxID=87 RepID=UPI0017D3679A|nr:metallophosphoesterase [Hyphomonas sp.]MBU3919208.1 metallophosphoesterase [Alphaproteobacteria bacterium]MBA3069982.1 serine/threonine protein phosphatase [Hyphomonas sp.]MBU4060442.1 metallophosphoesterase [Alphaproteobacteria bacterium]MBU4163110.1 metallophosphoesterase [Alphaproteobacteria bacterium]MBU4568549.1 metallophosphoesterase [Alphaproteobacteria bacterium]